MVSSEIRRSPTALAWLMLHPHLIHLRVTEEQKTCVIEDAKLMSQMFREVAKEPIKLLEQKLQSHKCSLHATRIMSLKLKLPHPHPKI